MFSRRFLTLSQSIVNLNVKSYKPLLGEALILNHAYVGVQHGFRKFAADATKQPSTDLLKDFIIPDPPPPPELLPLGPITAKTFNTSIWFPPGWICSMLLFCENYMPYYVAIIAVTVVGRLILTPVMIFSQKQAAKMATMTPKLQEIMKLRKAAEMRGDREKLMKLSFKMAEVYKSTDAFKIKNMVIAPICSIAVFGSFFVALRKMANNGHDPMKEGGFGPIYDLTISDPTYLLPTVTALTLFGVMKIGIEYGAITVQTTANPMQDFLKKASLFVVPGVIFYATSKMPSAVGLYWATSNSISIVQSLIMLNPKVRAALKIPATITKPKGEKKSIFDSVRKTIKDIKTSWKTMVDNRAARRINNEYINQFDRSGVGPLRKTFDYDPTKLNTKLKSKKV